jgi:adenine/guanine/hypoxanthine permease
MLTTETGPELELTASHAEQSPSLLERLFHLKANNTTVRTELVAGTTTFLAMAYIIFLQPAILAQAGMDFNAVMMATCISSALTCAVMAFLANYPIALAPGMGENFYFVFTVVIGMGVAWEQALGAVFISGVVFILLTLFRIRRLIIDAIPESMKKAIPAAIGLFITFIGLVFAGLVVKSPGGIVELGNLHEGPTMLALAGLAITLILMARKVSGALLIGMLVTAALGLATGITHFTGVFALPPSIAPTFMKLDITGAFRLGFTTVVLIFLLMAMLDTIGTFVGVMQVTGIWKNGAMPRVSRALFADAFGTAAGAVLGTSTVTSYIESATGVREGGRTGLTTLTVAFWMILAIFFSPLVAMVGGGVPLVLADGTVATLYPVIAPALILVGSFMAASLADLHWDDLTESIPAFLTIVVMPLTYSIGNGLAFGFILYPFLKLVSGRWREASWVMYLLAAIFLARYMLL